MALFLKLVCSSWRIQCLVFLKFFVVHISGISFLNEGLDYCCLGCTVIAKFLGAIFMVFVDVCLEQKDGIFGGEADAWCLPSGSNWGEGVGTMEPVLIGGLLWMGGNYSLVPMRSFVGDELTGKEKLDLWVARAGT